MYHYKIPACQYSIGQILSLFQKKVLVLAMILLTNYSSMYLHYEKQCLKENKHQLFNLQS